MRNTSTTVDPAKEVLRVDERDVCTRAELEAHQMGRGCDTADV